MIVFVSGRVPNLADSRPQQMMGYCKAARNNLFHESTDSQDYISLTLHKVDYLIKHRVVTTQ